MRNDEIIQRHRDFFASDAPGDRLVFISMTDGYEDAPSVEHFGPQINRYYLDHDGALPDHAALEQMVTRTVDDSRRYWAWRDTVIDDDFPRLIGLHLDIGIQTAAMTGMEPYFDDFWWLDCNLGRDEIDALPDAPDNRWMDMFCSINEILWSRWEGDFHFLPFWHRSPLDAANGIRGNEIFMEMYTAPERVKALTNWCVDCELAIERRLAEYIVAADDYGVGHMGFIMPPRAVWINGDPVALISREMMREFEQPYTGRLFTETGGGFFHNHTKGLYQVDQVARTPGIVLQHFNRDPNCPRVSDVLSGEPEARENLLAASRVTPIFPDQISPDEHATFLEWIDEGRFALDLQCPRDQVASTLRAFRR